MTSFNTLCIYFSIYQELFHATKMNYTAENQLAEMLKEFQSRSKAKAIPLLGGYLLILLFLFVGNCLTLLVMLLNPRMRTIPNMFVASLAISDLLLGLCSSVPFGVPALVTSHWLFNDTACQFQGYVSIMLVVASIHTLVLMAVNRYYRIVKPAKYQRYFTKKKTLIMILVSWFSSSCALFPFVLSGGKMVFHPAKFFCYFGIENTYMYYGSPLYIGVPTCYYLLLLENLLNSSQSQQKCSSSRQSDKLCKRRRS